MAGPAIGAGGATSRVDLAVRLLQSKARRARFFRRGWGPPAISWQALALRRFGVADGHWRQVAAAAVAGDAAARAAVSSTEQRRHKPSFDRLGSLVEAPPPVHLKKPVDDKKSRSVEGWLRSPLCALMPGAYPQESETVRFQLILPRDLDPLSADPKPPIYIHLAGTGDAGFSRRRLLIARPLLDNYGIASLILEIPHYGARRQQGQQGSFLLHLTDLFTMGIGLITEGEALLQWLTKLGFSKLGVTGISLGGHMASLVAANCTMPVACVGFMSNASSATVFTEGLLRHSVDWKALENTLPEGRVGLGWREGAFPGPPDQEAQKLMQEYIDLLTHLRNYPSPLRPDASAFIGASEDGYVRPWDDELPRIWPGTKNKTVEGGHVTSFFLHQKTYHAVLSEAMAAL